MLKRLQKFISKNKIEFLILLLIVVVAAFFRLYKISDYMTFLGDEGRDVLVAREILHGNLTLLGPRASAGDFFLGPIYYYMIAPFLFMSGYDPVGPAIMVALFGVATVILVYIVTRDFIGIKAGLAAAFLFAISPLVIAYSRSSWNPNLMPFFSLLLLYVAYLGLKKQNLKLFIVTGLLLGIAMQLHYLTVFLSVITLVFLVLGNYISNKKGFIKNFMSQLVGVIVGFILGIAPFLLFEIKNGFPNIKTIFRFIFLDNAQEGYAIGQSFIGNINDVFFRLFGRLVTKFPPPEQLEKQLSVTMSAWQIATIILAGLSVILVFKIKDKLAKTLLMVWLVVGVFLFAFYKKPIYDYYLGFLFPLPFILVGNLLTEITGFVYLRKIGGGISVIIFLIIVVTNLSGAPFLYPGNKQKDQAENIAEFIISKTDNKPYNFALLTKGNSDHVYRYFLEIKNRAPVTIVNTIDDPERKSVTDQLIVVCDYPNCSPLGDPLWEVAGFGRAEIVGKWEVPYVTIFKLVHYDGEAN